VAGDQAPHARAGDGSSISGSRGRVHGGARADDLREDDLRAYKVLDTRIAVANVGGRFYAFDDTCTHEGCSLAEGELEESTVTCRCHGSKFDVTDGTVLEGPARDPVETYETRVEDGDLKIEG
jgi:nitrite reductase/ring-hydroxylating ferredoxin subunit